MKYPFLYFFSIFFSFSSAGKKSKINRSFVFTLYIHLKNACNSSFFSSSIFSVFKSKTMVLKFSFCFKLTTILSFELKIKFTSSLKNLCFFSVLRLTISINDLSSHVIHHLSHIITTISSVSKNISVLSNCLFFNGKI
jgi:hypothetical protein